MIHRFREGFEGRSESVAIAFENVLLGYDQKPVLWDIDLQMMRSRVTTLLGPNGCGKTTLLKGICGLIRPMRGKILIDGNDVDAISVRELAKKMGQVSQAQRSSFPFSSLDVVLTGRVPHLSILSMPGQEDIRIALRSLAKLGAEHLADRPYTRISGGERQMVMIARALAQEPAYLLLDEPTSYLDFKNQIRLLKLIRQVARDDKVTVIMTLHDPNHAMLFSDEIVLLRRSNGQKANVVAFGPPQEVMTPLNIHKAYGVEAEVLEHKGRRILLPL